MRVTLLLATIAALPALSLPGQEPETRKPLTAREMFFAGAAAKPAAPVPAPAAAAPPAQSAPKQVARATRPKPEPATVAKSAPPPARPAGAPPRDEPSAVPSRPPSPALNPNLRTVAYTPDNAPLGVRYSILKRNSSGQFEEVAPDSVFRSGDRIRLSVEANDEAYLYIVHRGSSGTWKLMFPAANSAGGANHVVRGRHYLMPPGSMFTFVGEPGEEKLFLVLSRQPEPDLESLIDSLQEGAKPAAAPVVKPQRQYQLASLRMANDEMISRFRNLVSRDLITEKIDEEPAAGRPADKAVYVVNSTGRADSRVVADIQLKHE
jgi:hypothetical protein